MASWQRDNYWAPDDEYELIISILLGIGLHKLIIGRIIEQGIDTGYHLIDGGHRFRTMKRFINNEFYVNFTVENIARKLYYNKDQLKNDENNLADFPDLNMRFHNYRLDFDIYQNFTNNQAIQMFLKINKTGPLSVSAWLNASIHPIIIYLRDQYNNPDSDLCKYLYTFCKSKTKNHEYLNHLMPFLSAYYKFHKAIQNNEPITDDTVIQLFENGEPPTSKTSDTFKKLNKFIRDINNDINTFTPEFMNGFIATLKITGEITLNIWKVYKVDNTITQNNMPDGDILTGYVLSLMGKFNNDEELAGDPDSDPNSYRFIEFLQNKGSL